MKPMIYTLFYVTTLLLLICPVFSTKKITILVLGCHMDNILSDRMETAINFANKQPKDVQITWYLSGGTKHKLDNMISHQSEANKMVDRLDFQKNWRYHLDTKATNTAENFAYFRQWVEKEEDSEIYITTSSFHHQRAMSIVKGILVGLNYNWLLGELGYPNCKYDEIIHSKNIHTDIRNAISKYEMLG